MDKSLIIEWTISEELEETGCDIISFVKNPAIQRNFEYYADAEVNKLEFRTTDKAQRLVTGPAMIPDLLIKRLDGEGNEYFGYFSGETIKSISELYFKRGRQNTSNIEHEGIISDITVVESWRVTDPKLDKSVALGLGEYPAGTWMVTYKVWNEELWQKIVDLEVEGFSIEGAFIPIKSELYSQIEENLVIDENPLDTYMNKVLDIGVDAIKNILTSDVSDDQKLKNVKEILNGQ